MPKRSSTLEINQLAASIVERVSVSSEAKASKNPAAVALGRLGGLKGGRARAASLSKFERKQIARKAAKARWAKA